MRAVARIAYRAIVRFHPSAFREEFGDEMLWIFDEEIRSGVRGRFFSIGVPMRLLLDGFRSVLIQHAVRPDAQQSQREPAGPNFCQIESAIPIVRFAQAGFVAFSCLFCVLSVAIVASMVVPKFVANQKGWFPTSVRVFYSVPNSKP